MPKLSHKADILPASPIRKLVPYADAAKARGVKVYHLNIGQPDIETPAVALDAVKNIKERVLEYTHSAGVDAYREKLVGFYNKHGYNINKGNLLVTTGGSEAVLFSMMAIRNAGDEIIVPEPFYANYNSFAIEAGVNIVPITSKIETGFALPSVGEFKKVITAKTRAILICNPNNPTGYLYTQAEIEALRDIVKDHDLYLISDEVYSDFCYDNKTHYSVMHLGGVDDNVIMCDSVSKRYSMCGVRVGAIVSRNCAVMDAALRMGQARLCAPLLGQIAAAAAVDTPSSYFEQVKAEYVARRDFMVSALQKMDGVVCPKPSGAFYAIARLPVDSAEDFAKWLLEEFSYQNQTVMLAPATGFYSNAKTCPQNEVRLAYVLKIEDLRSAMQVLEIAIRQYNER